MTIDQQLFYFINTTCGNSALDWLAPMWREKLFWLPLYVFLAAFFLLNFKKNGLLILLMFAATVGTADFISSELIKKNVRRPRPCNGPVFAEKVKLRLANCGSGWSFPSSHAANHFAAAVFLGLFFGRRKRWVWPALIGWAASIALMQVYVGVHYPLDILGGAAVGSLVGFIGHEPGRRTNVISARFLKFRPKTSNKRTKHGHLGIRASFWTSLAGGAMAFFFKKIPRAQLKNILAFSGAYILGIVVLHLLGDVYGSGFAGAGRWILVGFFLQLLLDFLSKGIEHGHVHPTDEPGRVFLVQIMLGLCLHAFFEGLPLGGHAGFHENHRHAEGPNGLLIGIVLHETPASFTLASLLLLSNFRARTVWLCLIFKASMAPAGALAAGFMLLDHDSLAALTSVVIGLFLHIATTILFEADSSSSHRLAWPRLLAIAGGVGLAWMTVG